MPRGDDDSDGLGDAHDVVNLSPNLSIIKIPLAIGRIS
jgi:hypothetical protein